MSVRNTEEPATGSSGLADPMARAIFEQLRNEPVADRQHVLMAVRAGLTKRSPESIQMCLMALQTCQAETGRVSRGAYNDWRARQVIPGEWPSSQKIANALGSWRKASEAAGGNCVADVLALRLTESSQALDRSKVLRGIKRYGSTGRPLTQKAYFAWATAEIEKPPRPDEDLVRGANTIVRLFGSWANALIEAGLLDQLLSERKPERLPGGPNHQYSKESVVDWLVQAAPSCGGRLMTRKVFDIWAREQVCEALQRGSLIHIPHSTTVLRFFPSWFDALAAAGLMTKAEAAEFRGRRGGYLSYGYLLDRLTEAIEDLGSDLTTAQYKEWRRLQNMQDPPEGIPHLQNTHEALRHLDKRGPRSARQGGGRRKDMTRSTNQSLAPSPVAAVLAKLTSALPESAAGELERLLANSLGAPKAAELRERRLGLLVELVSQGQGEIPTVRRYEQSRQARMTDPRATPYDNAWPAASTLINAYGSFLAAVRAAMRLNWDGSAARIPHTHRHAKPISKAYTREEVITALRKFRDDHGSWPRSELEYLTWGETLRRLRREGGHTDPRIPTAKPIRKLFGSFERAVELAIRAQC